MILRAFLPTPESIRESRLVSWLGPRLHDRALWRVHREAVARGVAIGLLFAFLLPVAQIPLAAMFAFALRANLWASVGATLVSNPFTFAPIVYGAYRLGAWVVGVPDGVAALGLDPPDGLGFVAWLDFWWQRLHALGKPLLVGLSLLGVTASILGYFVTLLIWRAAIVLKRRRTLRARARR